MRVENGGKHREDNFGLRNREPARRVGVRRTIADCGFKSKETGVRRSSKLKGGIVEAVRLEN